MWSVGVNTIWSPVRNLDLGVEIVYASIKRDGINSGHCHRHGRSRPHRRHCEDLGQQLARPVPRSAQLLIGPVFGPVPRNPAGNRRGFCVVMRQPISAAAVDACGRAGRPSIDEASERLRGKGLTGDDACDVRLRRRYPLIGLSRPPTDLSQARKIRLLLRLPQRRVGARIAPPSNAPAKLPSPHPPAPSNRQHPFVWWGD